MRNSNSKLVRLKTRRYQPEFVPETGNYRDNIDNVFIKYKRDQEPVDCGCGIGRRFYNRRELKSHIDKCEAHKSWVRDYKKYNEERDNLELELKESKKQLEILKSQVRKINRDMCEMKTKSNEMITRLQDKNESLSREGNLLKEKYEKLECDNKKLECDTIELGKLISEPKKKLEKRYKQAKKKNRAL